MCEWLSNGEWFDVRFLCGGRTFNAHRAVLASVSSFLRNVLLSCPDETPVFIILPEFDLEAMPFVLYYIYNGEVIIPKQKLKIFFDTANAMELFIDQHYKIQPDYEQYCITTKSDDLRCAVEKYTSYFGLFQGINRCYINLKKVAGTDYLTHQMQETVDSLNLRDNNPKLCRRSEENVPELANLSSVYAYQQRESIESDILIKTYNQECNEGLTSYEAVVVSKSDSNFGHSNNISLMKELIGPHIDSRRAMAKVTILNEVLQNPWHPQQPKCYRPFPRKDRKSIESEKHYDNKTYSFNEMNGIALQFTTNLKEQVEYTSLDQQEKKCTICHKIFKGKQDYEVHLRTHSSGARYSCEQCHKTFSQLRNFKYHMSVHRGTKEFATVCSICGKHFNDRNYLSNHMKIHRNRKEYKCVFCPKSFNQRVAFNMHVRIHTGVKPHGCEQCGKAFSRKMLLKQHQRIHSGERPYACTHCGRCFADRSNMMLHLRLHTGVKPFSCTLCPKSFSKKHHLKSHLNFHTGVKPYSCPRCKLTFTQSSNMRTHLKKCSTAN